jgi:hypothetical protein
MGKKLINNTTLSDAEYRRARDAYSTQKSNALKRKDRNGNPIEWLFTFESWLDLWLKSGHWHQRGKGRGQYVMARFGDVGPYAPWNVEIKTVGENVVEAHKGRPKPPISEEQRKKLREANKGQGKGIPKPKMACVHCGKLCSAGNLKKYHNDNCRHNEANKGIPRPSGQKGIPKPKMTCVHCGKVGGAPQISRWHNDNCRHKV